MLHLLILLLFLTNFKDITFLPPQAQDKKISLNLQQIVTPPAPKPKPIVVPPKPKPLPVRPPVPKPIIEKKVEPKPEVQPIKKKILDERKKVFAEKSTEENNVTKMEPKPKKKIVKKEVKKKPVKKVVKKKVVKKVKKKRKQRKAKKSNDQLFNALMGAASTPMYPPSQSSSSGSYASKMINQLYGKEFDTYTPTQKKFIKNNLGTIHRITQQTLTRNGYPTVAIQTKQEGTNIVSFYLHPNGDITGLKLKRRMGYAALDQNTLDVIRIAYKNYPLPNKKTKIMFHVTYSLY